MIMNFEKEMDPFRVNVRMKWIGFFKRARFQFQELDLCIETS